MRTPHAYAPMCWNAEARLSALGIAMTLRSLFHVTLTIVLIFPHAGPARADEEACKAPARTCANLCVTAGIAAATGGNYTGAQSLMQQCVARCEQEEAACLTQVRDDALRAQREREQTEELARVKEASEAKLQAFLDGVGARRADPPPRVDSSAMLLEFAGSQVAENPEEALRIYRYLIDSGADGGGDIQKRLVALTSDPAKSPCNVTSPRMPNPADITQRQYHDETLRLTRGLASLRSCLVQELQRYSNQTPKPTEQDVQARAEQYQTHWRSATEQFNAWSSQATSMTSEPRD